MTEHPGGSRFEHIITELRRIGLDVEKLTGLAVAEADIDAFLTHLRSLPYGASWSAAFPGTPHEWSPDTQPPERALGPFDYSEPPRGTAVFASLDAPDPGATGAAALKRVEALGLPIYGSGVVLDRGSPHLYVVLARGADEDAVSSVVEYLSAQPGIINCYPIREEGDDPTGD
jgi:hypothetical protein